MQNGLGEKCLTNRRKLCQWEKELTVQKEVDHLKKIKKKIKRKRENNVDI